MLKTAHVNRLYYVGIIFSALFLFSGSWHFRTLSPHSLDEPHVLGPSWEVAAREELLLRCGSNYAVGVSTCSSFSGVIDGIYLKIASVLTKQTISLKDPEFVNPLLQWLLVVKRGLLIAFLLVFCWKNLVLVTAHRLLSFFTVLGFCLTPELLARGFEVSVNGEAGAGIFFIFTVFLRNLKTGQKTRDWESIVAGSLAAVRIPVLLFSFLTVRSPRNFLVLSFSYLVWTLGLFRSSYDVGILRRIVETRGVRFGISEEIQTLPQLLLHNFSLISAQHIVLFPLAALGFIQLFRYFKGWNALLISWLLLITYLALGSWNSQARYFIGFTGIYLSLCAMGLLWSHNALQPYLKQKMRYCLAALGVLFLGWNLRYLLVPFVLLANPALTQLPLAPGEEKILHLAKAGKELYVDHRVRLNLNSPIWDKYRAKIHFLDLFNEPLPAHAQWVLPCYSEIQLTRDFHVSSNNLFQCHKTLIDQEVSMPVSLRVTPAFGALGPEEAVKPIRDLLRLPLRDLWGKKEIFPSSHPIFQFSPRFAIGQQNLSLVPRLAPGEAWHSPALSWKAEGDFSQDWESQIVSRNGADFSGFQLSRRLYTEAKNIEIDVDCSTNFRQTGSSLQIAWNGKVQASCDLNSQEDIFNEMPWARRFGNAVIEWKRKFYPCRCKSTFPVTRGTGILSIKLVPDDHLGQVRFQGFRLKGL